MRPFTHGLTKLALLAAAGSLSLALGLQPAGAATSTPTTVACGAANTFSTNADAATLALLQASVLGIALNPSGMSCSLDTTSNTNSSGAGTGGFVVGGGRYVLTPSACAVSFGLSAHVNKNGPNGTQTVDESNAPSNLPCGGQGHLKANVTCIAINGNDAEIRGDIQEQSGSLGPSFFPPGYNVWVTDVQDNGKPSSGTPDTIVQYTDQPGSEQSCKAPSGNQLFTVQNGNITVHS